MKKIKPEDVAYELRELSKNNSLSPEVINIISHGYERICELERERDEARHGDPVAARTTEPHRRRLAMTTTTDTSAMTLAQKSDRILAKTRGLSGATPNATQLIEALRSALEENRREVERLTAERDEARRYSCDLEARITMLEEDRRDTSNNFGTNPCSEIILPDYPLARDPKEIAKRKGWDCYKEETK